ncbi:hypothetical protein B0H14DRAFT_3141236 [Mycena olivaceomarginata]|nr:hypothetical protein B0H14DRAFT_3141236 [Mycena olivaceomarginata]
MAISKLAFCVLLEARDWICHWLPPQSHFIEPFPNLCNAREKGWEGKSSLSASDQRLHLIISERNFAGPGWWINRLNRINPTSRTDMIGLIQPELGTVRGETQLTTPQVGYEGRKKEGADTPVAWRLLYFASARSTIIPTFGREKECRTYFEESDRGRRLVIARDESDLLVQDYVFPTLKRSSVEWGKESRTYGNKEPLHCCFVMTAGQYQYPWPHFVQFQVVHE